jgi:hypothetical protein
MKNFNLKNAQKLNREAQKRINGGDLIFAPCQSSGCHYNYLSDGRGRCTVPPCNTSYGTESFSGGRWRCCF